jgi:hypothetical protein
MITTTHSLANTTQKFLLVGDCHQVIAAYDTAAEAAADLDNKVPSIDGSPWCRVDIVSPGQTINATFSAPVPRTASEEAELAKQLAAMPWMIKA